MTQVTTFERFSLAKSKAKEIIKFHSIKAPMDKAMEAQLKNHATFAVCDFIERFQLIDKKISEVKKRLYEQPRS